MAILTISREFGSGGREIGHAVAERMRYAYINKETISADVGTAAGKWGEWGKAYDEHCPTIWEKHDWSFRGFGALLQSHILKHAVQNNVVIMGRGGNFLLQGVAHALRIRVVAPLEQKIQRVMKRESVDLDTARWLIEKTDKGRDCFIYALYGKHWDVLAEYDMVFDMGTQSIDSAVARIEASLLEKDTVHSPAVQKNLAMRSLAADVKAAILTDSSLFIPTLDVDFDSNGLALRGVIHNPEEHRRVEDKAKALAGDVPVRCELHYRIKK